LHRDAGTEFGAQRVGRREEHIAVAGIGDVDWNAAGMEQARRCCPASRQAGHTDFAPGGPPVVEPAHRSLRVAIATSAQKIPRIQNRTTTVISCQPSFSKWGCRGAIRNTRWESAYSL